jgi:hypothetical protein
MLLQRGLRVLRATAGPALRVGAPVRCASFAGQEVVNFDERTAGRSILGDVSIASLTEGVYTIFQTGEPAADLFDGIASEAILRVSSMTAADLSKMSYCFHKGGATNQEWYRAVAREAAGRIEELLAPEVATVLLIAVREGVYLKALFDAVTSRVVPCINKRFERQNDFSGRELALIAEAFNSAEQHDPTLVEGLAADVVRNSTRYSPEDLETVEGFVTVAGGATPSFREAVAAHPAAWKASVAAEAAANEDYAEDAKVVYTMGTDDSAAPRAIRKSKIMQMS